jgi:hypothetical protein
MSALIVCDLSIFLQHSSQCDDATNVIQINAIYFPKILSIASQSMAAKSQITKMF